MKSNIVNNRVPAKPRIIPPEIIEAILKRGYVAQSEVAAVYGKDDETTPNHVKMSIARNKKEVQERIWLVHLVDETYVFANHALTFYPNYSWGALCFFKNGQYDHKRTEKNLSTHYEEYFADYTKALKVNGKQPKKR